MSDFYRRLDEIEQKNRLERIFKDRPENLHDYQGCANDPSMNFTPAMTAAEPPKVDYQELDREETERFANAFIAEINADHSDRITISRDAGCRIRDHIENLRRAIAKA